MPRPRRRRPRPSTPSPRRGRRRRCTRQFDGQRGGFGGAPKFPPSMVLEFLLRHHERTGSSRRAGAWPSRPRERDGPRRDVRPARAAASRATASTRGWVVPHFEKMLYDNALLLRVYAASGGGSPAIGAGRCGSPDETADFLLRDLRTAEGGFASALDADTDGVEGDLRRGRPAQLAEVLGADDGPWAAQLLRVTAAGTFEHGASTLQLPADPDDPPRWARGARRAAGRPRRAPAAGPRRQGGHRLERAGDRRARRGRGRCSTGRAWVAAAAARAPSCCSDRHLVDGRLRRTSRDGVVGAAAGVLEDYGDLADGLLALHQATGDPRWLDCGGRAARRRARRISRDAERDGGFFDTADDAEALLHRPARDHRQRHAVRRLRADLGAAHRLRADRACGRYRDAAEAALHGAGTLLRRHPRFAGPLAHRGRGAGRTGPLQVAIAGDGGPTCWPRAAADRPRRHGGRGGRAGRAGRAAAGRHARWSTGAAAAYVCRGFVCDRPVTTPDAVAAAVRARRTRTT